MAYGNESIESIDASESILKYSSVNDNCATVLLVLVTQATHPLSQNATRLYVSHATGTCSAIRVRFTKRNFSSESAISFLHYRDMHWDCLVLK